MLARITREQAANEVYCSQVKHADDARRFKAASLFTGIGGFDIGLERAGFDIIFQCEINKFCRSILKVERNKVNVERP
jgi:hypothetical protein